MMKDIIKVSWLQYDGFICDIKSSQDDIESHKSNPFMPVNTKILGLS